ncbi:hypothetical protein KAS14_07795, partial [Candidatus Bathyarchaeota archaeon]|nr:hypothetical protein [Candidatus Bathyarchaeota archaeon]
MQSKERVDDQHLTVIKNRHRIYAFLSRMYEKEMTEDLLKDLASEKCPILQIEVEDLVEEKIREGFKMLRGYLKR